MAYSLQQIAEHIGGEVKGNAQHMIQSMGTLAKAQQQQLSFLSNNKYAADLTNTKAGAVILNQQQAADFVGNAIVHKNPYVGFALASQLLDTTPLQALGVSALASVDASVKLGRNVAIGPGVTVNKNAVIGDNVSIGAGSFVGENCVLGDGCNLRANVTLYHGVSLGKNVSIHSGTVLGSDGFGYANDKGVWVKIPQTGGVRIGDDTEIGANTCIDRGALDDTVIGKNCIIDNMVQIAHNCTIGDYTCICGTTGMAGSVNIGKHVVIAGSVVINGHLDICDNVQITGFSMVTKSITQPGSYSSGMPAVNTRDWQKNTVKLRTIDKLYDRVKALENKLVK
ncbi:UDP-3-O-(3-hydroxymyristoyl)glucosamine N-acyltransferase [Glaciecola sp. SC05]|uniref:UDP-3-O-(3-hydroxymyristoyl)glucosamine N-acyltransferase n=1 Tax=Glaciecola sp. SC05 TaxID=1987355 RepID=UPI0035288BE6